MPGVAGGEEIAKATGVDFFSTPVELGVSLLSRASRARWISTLTQFLQPNGVEKAINVLDGVTDQEKKLLEACIKGLKGNIEKGVDFAKNPPPK